MTHTGLRNVLATALALCSSLGLISRRRQRLLLITSYKFDDASVDGIHNASRLIHENFLVVVSSNLLLTLFDAVTTLALSALWTCSWAFYLLFSPTTLLAQSPPYQMLGVVLIVALAAVHLHPQTSSVWPQYIFAFVLLKQLVGMRCSFVLNSKARQIFVYLATIRPWPTPRLCSLSVLSTCVNWEISRLWV